MESLTASAAPSYFQASLPLIEDVIAFHVCRGRLNWWEREDFRSFAMEKLIEDDYKRLRKFEGRSSLRSFLSVVVANLLIDYWASKGGRRRPSSTAKQLAPEGVWLERYLGDGYRLSEAIHLVIANHQSPLSEDELYHIALRLPPRKTRPKQVSEPAADPLGPIGPMALMAPLEKMGSLDASPERLVEARREDATRARLEEALDGALEALSPDERVFVRMRFEDGSRINEIAKAFHLPERIFYRQFQRTLRGLRHALEARGVDAGCLALYRDSGPRAANFRARAV